MGKLHDALKAVGYQGHALEVYLVRLLFCLFGEDTTIFEKRLFQDYIETKTNADGSDLAHHLSTLFYVLNTAPDKRLKNLDESLAAFPYVNGKLFEESLPPAQFDAKMRDALLDLCALDWSIISPAIFGSLFQSIMNAEARRNLGAHYTSEENILKLIKPLFLDALWVEFNKIKGNKNRLVEFHKKLRTLTFFDPACGCGNFLVITYRELRLLELEVLRASRNSGQQVLDVETLINVDVDQFHGIEIEEFPAQIAQVALWLTDHQMNMKVSEEFGSYFARIPLKATPHIVCANALQVEWGEFCHNVSFILGNPPFLGKSNQSAAQKSDMQLVCGHIKNAGLLDFVSAWYVKATCYIAGDYKGNVIVPSPEEQSRWRGFPVDDEYKEMYKRYTGPGKKKDTKCAFVSTNSITQGEQVGVLWGWMLSREVKIQFAHRTFNWTNEARGKAAVHCVIIGFGMYDETNKVIYEYEDIKGEPHAINVANINPYLVDAPDLIIEKSRRPICGVPEMTYGSKPVDGGNLLFTAEEMTEFIKIEPQAKEYIRPFIGSEELINGNGRYCLWLKDVSPQHLRQMPLVMARIEAVRKMRLASAKIPTQDQATTPTLFGEIRQPKTDYLAVPEVSSERRKFVPMAYLTSDIVASNRLYTIQKVTVYHFGVICSSMHMAWMRILCGRLKSDFTYSASLVYNNFPWPEVNTLQTQKIEAAGLAVLDARAVHTNASLADLYDPLTMPANLLEAHQALDKAVDIAYSYKGAKTDAARVAFLFERYQQLTSLLPSLTKAKKISKKNK